MRLPPDFERVLAHYGRHRFNPSASEISTQDRGGDSFEYELYQIAQRDPDGFIEAVAAVAIRSGDWAVYGGEQAVMNAVGTGVTHPDYLAMLDGAIAFLRSQGYNARYLAPYMVTRWEETHPEAAR